LFDEIEKASDALWNLLLGILDKATLTLGDNRRVDFSRTLIFLTSNLGAAEMSSIRKPGMGFAASELERLYCGCEADTTNAARVSRAGIAVARRRFNPEFMNRLDKVTVFNPLGEAELRKILGIELDRLRRQILDSSPASPFAFELTEAARDHVLQEGTDSRYGARHLKRAIDRSLVQPLSNLVATHQVREGDWIIVDFDDSTCQMTFTKEAENLPSYALKPMTEVAPNAPDRAGADAPTLAACGSRKSGSGRGRDVAA